MRDAFARAGVIVLRGDWTRRDPAITRYLTAQGAAGVPLYVWYPAGGGAPQRLPQVLTPGSLYFVGRRYKISATSASAARSCASACALSWWTRGTLTDSTPAISDRLSSSTK